MTVSYGLRVGRAPTAASETEDRADEPRRPPRPAPAGPCVVPSASSRSALSRLREPEGRDRTPLPLVGA